MEPVSNEHEGPLAEFAALRQEIEARELRRQSLFNLHVTASGAVLGYTISPYGSPLVALILPFTTYLFCARYVTHSGFVQEIGRYIRDELSAKVPGGLHWEAWHAAQPRLVRIPRLAMPTLVAFPFVSLVSLCWCLVPVAGGWSGATVLARLVVLAAWLAGCYGLFLTYRLASDIDRRWRESENSV
ncbi:hypothetical protein ACIBKY_08725 [Nonomuraea sp. NPDC050394]|uniref:hypothetical protein n=1 Tax=Nonomuraea sp. NPDC050394 TaxID=3364363 RepID=UPI0037A00079